jgi:hypothetical protein
MRVPRTRSCTPVECFGVDQQAPAGQESQPGGPLAMIDCDDGADNLCAEVA